MREFRQKRRMRRWMYSRLSIIILIAVLLLLINATWRVYQKYRESRNNLIRVNSQLTDLSNRGKLLSSDVAKLQTNQGMEDEIRSKYDVSKPGEEVVVIIDKGSLATNSTSTKAADNWWQKFLALFKRN